MRLKVFTASFCLLISFSCYAQPVNKCTQNELECMRVFNNFLTYLNTEGKRNNFITDSSNLKYLLVNYLFVDKKIDTNSTTNFYKDKFNSREFDNLKKEIFSFYGFLQKREHNRGLENLKIYPLRLSGDTFIFNKLTLFQKNNTFRWYDERFPSVTLGYILFVPSIKNLILKPKIWSWTLMYSFGKYYFKSMIGEEGHEYLFEN